MSRDKAMTHSAWVRVWDAVTEGDKRKQDQRVIKLKPIEEAMVKNIRNQRGIAVQMHLKNEELLEATKREMAHARKIVEDRLKAVQEAQQKIDQPYGDITVESAVSADDDLSKGDK